jgi:ABC-type nitrate/sulfonate/bicarbonate transport system substrate-binding protein
LSRKFSIVLSISLLIVLVAVIFFTWQEVSPHKKYPVTIAVSKTPLSAPFYVAKAINAFNNTCANVSYVEVIGGQRAFKKVIEGDVDFGTSSDSVIAFESLSKQSFVTHAMFVQSDNDVKLITRTSDNINRLTDLKGKKVGITRNTASEYFLSILLAIEGLTLNDVQLIDYKPEQLTSALNQNQVAAIVPWEPYAFNASVLLNNQIKIHNTKNINTLSFNLISKKADQLLVEKATCVLEGLTIAIEYIAEHPEKAKQMIVDALGVERSFIDWVWSDYIFKLELNQSLLLHIKAQAEWAIDMNLSDNKTKPNINSYVDSRAMLQVNPEAVSSML